uniref:E3 ubiquitin-protein ligase CHFR n=1 Tax=Sphenodon punctatus TaxID=8508 RepID=A0A8D0HM97_SPHPU
EYHLVPVICYYLVCQFALEPLPESCRGVGVTYQLVSKICPLMISRNHCVFKQNADGQWTVTDNKSLNGVWLNQERIDPLKAYPIRQGDHIQLGVPLENKETNLFLCLQHQHRALMEELSRSKKDFEEIIQAKNRELEETKEEKEQVRAQKEEVLSQMNDVLENELQCTICSEHFIEAVTLNCAHSFCSYCINEWMKRKVECPICRREIHSKTRSLVLDNCIDRMVGNLSLDMKQHRLSLIRERKEKQDVFEHPDSDSDSSILTSAPSILSISSYEYDSSDLEEDDDSYYII